MESVELPPELGTLEDKKWRRVAKVLKEDPE